MAILQHAISISAMRAFGPREADVRTVEVESEKIEIEFKDKVCA
jgi:hypothetical protein